MIYDIAIDWSIILISLIHLKKYLILILLLLWKRLYPLQKLSLNRFYLRDLLFTTTIYRTTCHPRWLLVIFIRIITYKWFTPHLQLFLNLNLILFLYRFRSHQVICQCSSTNNQYNLFIISIELLNLIYLWCIILHLDLYNIN